MSLVSPNYQPGQKVHHPDFGEGVVIAVETTGFVRVFFMTLGERQVPAQSLEQRGSWSERIIAGFRPATPDAVEKLWLAIEAAELPLMESAATLTSAKVDLLPHQVVLVHRVANAEQRRFLIADEVGLGKTIETALILRELASRGEMQRALMVVPAGLVENWRHELNDVFNLDFEVFGSEGDVTDRKSNAFAKHHRLIASVDTLKKPARVKRLLEAPPWDLVVFDEAHHLSVYKNGRKTSKTENFKLAEALRHHCRDLMLLSATPHQGDHFRFWMLVRLLHPSLFVDEHDMVDNRHRLNAVVVRRTKADACSVDGSPLFARRMVHSESFKLSPDEKAFYEALLEYLRDGYNLAELQGQQGRALGFIMTIFQKIAASSFAAVRATLQRRMLMLTIHEAIERDESLDVDGRDRTLHEAREMISEMHGLGDDPIGRAQVDQLLAEAKYQLLKKRKEYNESELADISGGSEIITATGEDAAVTLVSVALPEERRRIRELLLKFPPGTETKTRVLLNALQHFWQANPDEKIVIFTTYLGSLDGLRDAIDAVFPGKGVEVLKGGDHGAKVAAQRRFQRKDGPRVLLCTAAGREGINLQFARILFNHDLPWNPMDLEQRIGRIHRYGQKSTAQVYNLVAEDTIEGTIFLMLEDKLQDIAQALGKVDENGQVTEDLRSQILGQLSNSLSYEKLYQEAVRDPSLRQTRQEIEVAMTNAKLAREVVFELFQDLERFNLGEYKRFDDDGRGMQRLISFVQRAAHRDGGEFRLRGENLYELVYPAATPTLFTTDRELAMQEDSVDLLGLEHPIVRKWMDQYLGLPAEERGVISSMGVSSGENLLTIWQVTIHGSGGHVQQRIVRIGLNTAGERAIHIERMAQSLLELQSSSVASATIGAQDYSRLLGEDAPKILHREIEHSGALPEGSSYNALLLGAVVVS